MKPISIRFQCFGPYMEEQYIDFRELEKNGLFLICGETGSGKTTILDAMCYALYGKSSGGSRGDLLAMRCKRAGPSDETLVEFIFSSGADTYRFFRSRKPKKQKKSRAEAGAPLTFNEEYECQLLKDGQFIPLADAKATQTYLDQKAAEILGLTYEQFQQVVILPQGKFEKLLTSDSAEKEKILVTLFHANKWQLAADAIYRQAVEQGKRLDMERVGITEKLKRYGCQNLDELTRLYEKTKQELEICKQRAALARQETQYCRTILEQAKNTEQAFRELDFSERKLQKLYAAQPARQADKDALQRAEWAESITSDYRACREKTEASRKADSLRREADRNLRQAEEKLWQLEEEKQAHENERQAYEAQKEKQIVLQNLEALYQSIATNRSILKAAEKDLRIQETELEKSDSNRRKTVKALETAVSAQDQAIQEFQQGQTLYLKEIGSVLALQLEEGKKCPVCGSIHHPEPAQPTAEHISEETLNILEQTMLLCSRQVKQAREAQSQAEQQYRAAETAVQLCRRKTEAAASVVQAALNQRYPDVEDETARLAALKALEQGIISFEQTERSMQETMNTAAGDQKSAVRLAQQAKQTAEAAALALGEVRTQWEARRSDYFPDDGSYLDACMDGEQRQMLQTGIIQFTTDLQNAEADAGQKREALKELQRPIPGAAERLLNEAEDAQQTLDSRCVLLDKEQKDLHFLLHTLEKQLPAYEESRNKNNENLEFASRLKGDNGIGLQRYVLGVMLTSITGAANRLLKTVYGGRYQLYRTDVAAGKKHKRGLDLEVADQDGRRSVNSLSGGEKFLLSLSLGIGLSTVVQAQGSGIRLEAMFIDEGFGSLDEKSIYDAMEILETVRRSAGIVGIISHVDSLAETIPSKIEITKTKDGSRCKVRC